MNRPNTHRGFTLIELLVVIAIIGILSSVVLASLNSARQKSRDARRISDVKQVQLALEMYYDSNSAYPTTAEGIAELQTAGFIPSLPIDPQTATSSDYGYYSADGSTYTLRSTLETDHNVLDGDTDGAFGATSGGCDDSTSYYYCVQP